MKFLKLSYVTGEGDRGLVDHQDGELGEDDVPVAVSQPTQQTIPVTILDPATRIRSFTPRKYGRVGTRIVFMSGAGMPVAETMEEVEAKIAALYN